MPSTIIENPDLEKPSIGPSKRPRKLKTAKNSKLSNLAENYFEPAGKGGWPPISTWITLSSLLFSNVSNSIWILTSLSSLFFLLIPYNRKGYLG
jgi:hypothetical protein